MRGSIAACAISTRRLSATKNSASTRMVPCSSGRSRWKIAELSSSPEPGHENTVSIRIEPPLGAQRLDEILAQDVAGQSAHRAGDDAHWNDGGRDRGQHQVFHVLPV